jgi:O-antigen ligase
MMPRDCGLRISDCGLMHAALSVTRRYTLSVGRDARLRLVCAGRLTGGLALALLSLFLAQAPLTWAVSLVAGAGLIVAVALEPAVGLVSLAALIPFGRLISLPLAGGNVVDLLVALALAAWLAQGVARRAIVFRPPPLTCPILVFIWSAGLSLTQAASWREGLPEWIKWAEFAALYLISAQILDSKRMAWVLVGLFVGGLAEVALGAYQFFRQEGPEAFILMGRFMRAYGTFQQPNPYAGYLGCLAPVAASLAIAAWEKAWSLRRTQTSAAVSPFGTRRSLAAGGIASQKPLAMTMALICSGVALACVLGIGMSWSRGSWLGLGAALVAVVGLRNRRSAGVALVLLLALVLVVALFGTGWLPTAIVDRLADPSTGSGQALGDYLIGPDPARTEITDANFAVLERLAHWQAGLRMFDDHPWLGVGIGNYGVAYARYALPHWYDALGHAHNVYVNFMAETGALGAGAFMIFWLAAAWQALQRGWRRTRKAEVTRMNLESPRERENEGFGFRRALAVGVLGTLVYLTVHNLFDNLFVQHIQLQLALLLGGIFSTIQEKF